MMSGCTLTFSTSSVSTTTLTDERHLTIESEYSLLISSLPSALTQDVTLPTPSVLDMSLTYLVDGIVLQNRQLKYEKLAFDKEIQLTLRFEYKGVIIDKIFIVIQLRDEILYNEAQVDLFFDDVYSQLLTVFPVTISSDFNLPILSIAGVSINYSVDHSRIYNSRFIFTFPLVRQTVNFTARITYKSITRDYNIPVTMNAINELPQIPEIHITTLNNESVTSKDYYVPGSLSLKVFDQNLVSTTLIENASMQIRVRGNSTAFMPKKPYKIKFEVKTSMLSEYAQKDWVLLANYTDHTLIRNYLAYNMAKNMGMEYTPSAQFVDVYMNQEYLGNYMLTDQIEVSPNRINIEEDSSDIDTGYLIELDQRLWDYNDKTENYFFLYNIYFVIKSPSRDSINYSQDQYNYIENYINTLYLTLHSQLDYSHLIDEASFIDWFIVQEVFKNVDSGYSSVFFYKPKGEKLKMGPIWDFDLSAGNPGHLQYDLRIPEGWYTSLEFKNIFFHYLMKYPSFRANLKARWNEIYESNILSLLDQIYPTSDSIAKSRYLNFNKWDIIGKNWDWYTAQEVYDAKTYEDQMWFLYYYLDTRIHWLNNEIQKF